MDLKRKEFWKTFLQVFLVSLVLGVMGTLVGYAWGRGYIILILIILNIYSFVEACRVCIIRAAIRDESVSRVTDYIFAFLRFFAIEIPPLIVTLWLVFLWIIFIWRETGYHG